MSVENNSLNILDHNVEHDVLQLVSFNIADEEFAIDILNIQEINRISEVTRVPNTPEFVKGVINLRGKVVPVIDLRLRLGQSATERNSNTRIIVFEVEGKIIGFIVDRVNEVIRINRSATEPQPSIVSGIEAKYITAIAKLGERLLILLDLKAIISLDTILDVSEIVSEAS